MRFFYLNSTSCQSRFVLQWVQYENKAINGEDEYDIIQLSYW